jgi:hypothetical protein
MKRSGFLLTIGCALVLSACGGGGGDPSIGGATGTTPPAPVQTLSPIAAESATRVAANAYAASSTFDMSSSFASDLLTGVSITPAGTAPGAVAPVLGLVKRAIGSGTPKLLTGVTMTEGCSGGGTVTIDSTLRNDQTLSNGDTISITANNCSEDGDVLNGTFSIAVSGIVGNPFDSPTGAVTLDTKFKSFSIVSAGTTGVLNGDMKIAVNVTSTSQSTLNVSGASLQAVEQKAGTTQTTLTMTNYSVKGSTDGSTTSSASTFTLAGTSNGLGSFNYSVKNLQPFVSNNGAMPASGSLIVNGAGASVTATALNSSSVRVDYSAKGDGVITQTKTLSWLEFLASY